MTNYNNNNDDGGNAGSQQQKWCKVYDKHDFFTVFVQMMLAFACLVSLYFKRLQEVPRRTFLTWFLDISKQAFGACYAHVLNMMIAGVIAHNTRGSSKLYDQCAWYGLAYLIDTTLGLFLAIFFLWVLDIVANKFNWTHLKNSGVYTGDFGWLTWITQVLAWMFIMTISKLIIYLIMWTFSGPLAWIGEFLFRPFQSNIRFELLFVMIFFPGFLNIIYFWIADSYLKAKKENTDAHENDETGLEDKKEALMTDAERCADSAILTGLEYEAPYLPTPWTWYGARPAPSQQQPQQQQEHQQEQPSDQLQTQQEQPAVEMAQTTTTTTTGTHSAPLSAEPYVAHV